MFNEQSDDLHANIPHTPPEQDLCAEPRELPSSGRLWKHNSESWGIHSSSTTKEIPRPPPLKGLAEFSISLASPSQGKWHVSQQQGSLFFFPQVHAGSIKISVLYQAFQEASSGCYWTPHWFHFSRNCSFTVVSGFLNDHKRSDILSRDRKLKNSK